MRAPVKESAIVHSCLQWLYVHGCDVVRCNTGATKYSYTSKKTGQQSSHYVRFGKKGMGDIIACSPFGRWIEVEAKTATGKQQPEQIMREEEILRRGGVYILARSVDDLEVNKTAILAKIFPCMPAEGAHPDHRVKPTSRDAYSAEEHAI